MNGNELIIIFDILIWFSSLYCFYTCCYMKKHKQILKNPLLIPQGTDISACRDIPGYIHYMYPRLLVFSALCFVFGGLNLISSITSLLPVWLTLTVIFFLLLVIFWLWYVIKKSIRMFW